MTITREQARTDLEKVMLHYGTIGTGNENDRAAQLVIQTLGVLERRLDNPKTIKMLYIDNPDASKLIPPTVYTVAQQYIAGTITREQAKERLQEASRQYGEVFMEMGVSPQTSAALFSKR